MLNCREAAGLCSDALDRPLGLRERLSLRMHLMMCSSCTNFEDQMAHLRAITRRYAEGRFDTETEGASQLNHALTVRDVEGP